MPDSTPAVPLFGQNLSPDNPNLQRKLREEMDTTPLEHIDACYDQIAESRGGTFYGTDIAKKLFHRAFTSPQVNMATGLLARDYFHARYLRDLASERHPDRELVVFTAGGPGSGKSETLIQGLLDFQTALVVDSTLTNLETACQLIEAALSANKGVIVAYVHRPVEDAMNFALERFGLNGMFIEPERLGRDHWRAQQVVMSLNSHFQAEIEEGLVEIHIYLNVGTLAYIHRIENGIDFFLNPDDPTTRYATESDTVHRAVEADHGRIRQALHTRAQSNDQSLHDPSP